jgi:hypothetical protein
MAIRNAFPPVEGLPLNYLDEYATSPHRLVPLIDLTGCTPGALRIIQDARVAHHVLDEAHVPAYTAGREGLGVRVLTLATAHQSLGLRIEAMTRKHREVDGACAECGERFPCTITRIADGRYRGPGGLR